mmetsp:Transcript_3359/g.5709  ORF Transcript_3359/g.5709 Transcript_3359/m.5709 type:complete len:117 (-) Transcript_3359:580-930(-)
MLGLVPYCGRPLSGNGCQQMSGHVYIRTHLQFWHVHVCHHHHQVSTTYRQTSAFAYLATLYLACLAAPAICFSLWPRSAAAALTLAPLSAKAAGLIALSAAGLCAVKADGQRRVLQ